MPPASRARPISSNSAPIRRGSQRLPWLAPSVLIVGSPSGQKRGLETALDLQAADQGAIDLRHPARVADVLQVGAYREPVGQVDAVIQLGAVLGVLYRKEAGIVVVVEAGGLVGQAGVLA